MERRLFPRVYKCLPVEYQAHLQDTDGSASYPAVMKNISMSGLFFMSRTKPLLKTDDIADFIFKFPHTHPNPLIPKEIRAKGIVQRIEQPNAGSPHFGVAVKFLSGPVFVYGD